jgi:hypothetical protein
MGRQMNLRFIVMPAVVCTVSLSAQASQALDIPRPTVQRPTISIPRPSVTVPTQHPLQVNPAISSDHGIHIQRESSGSLGASESSSSPPKTSSQPTTSTSGPMPSDLTSGQTVSAKPDTTTNMSGPNSPSNQTSGQTVSAKPSATGGSPNMEAHGCGLHSKESNCRRWLSRE